MLSWLNPHKPLPPECVGLNLNTDGFSCCVVNRTTKKIVSAHSQSMKGDAALADTLLHFVRDHGLKGHICYVSLGPDDYKLLSAETPAVPEAEVNQALLWGLRDVIDSKPEDTVLASFASASGIHRPGKPIRQVVTARKVRIRAIVDAVLASGLELGAIEIPELSQRNIIALLQEDAIGVGLISQSARGVSLALYRGGELYVTRQLAGIANLSEAGHPLTAPKLAEQLGLELLRTLDYYDSQLRQRPPAAIFLQPLQTETRPLLDGLSATVNLPVKQLRFADAVAGGENFAPETQERCFVALGAALRSEAA
jgi:MSHA biogenesis protein MshI